ncbi:diacylglycerol kinase family protein [Lacticaseibacillus jixiensis]|uniref:diacylglycerol kinase family protein n=1 Tax=Lacticaseibacillus jixiensis TaxID=3231926 RepID=UPI0036F20F4A
MALSDKYPYKNHNFGQSLHHALRGLGAIVKRERNFRFDLIATLVVAGLGWWLQVSRSTWLWLIAASGLVLIAEAFNSAIEALMRWQVGDRFDPDPRISRVLDMAAGAVLVAALIAALIGVIALWPYLVEALT